MRVAAPMSNDLLSSAAVNLLALFLIAAGPVWDYLETRSMKAKPSGPARLRYYRQTLIWLWAAAGIACWANGFGALFTLRGLGIHVAWIMRHPWSWWLLTVLVALFAAVQLVLPVAQVSIRHRKRPFLEPKQLEPMRFFLPASKTERRWFAALCLTAGFTEELLFRGFLLRYLHTAPLHLGFVWSALAAALVFAAYHLYQGRKGVLAALVGGLMFTAILLLTGNLAAGMLYHAAVDMSLLLYWRPRAVESVAA
jgi:membrane protease YdiL (CAAX protease family)